MDCRAVERNLSLFVDDELEPKARLAIEVHLRRCASCEASYRKLTSLKSCLGRTRTRVRAPADFTHALQSRLRTMESRTFLESQRVGWKQRRTIMMTVVGTAVLLAAGLFALVGLTMHAAEQQQAPQNVAQGKSGSATLALGRSGATAIGALFLRSRVSGADAAAALPPLSRDALAERSPEQKPWVSVTY